MLLSISTTHRPASELVGMLGQHPDAVPVAALGFGEALLCFPQVNERRCTVAVMLQLPGTRARPGMLAEAVEELLVPAPGVEGPPMPFEVALPVLPCPGGPERLWALYGPLGYDVVTEPVRGGAPDELAVVLHGRVPLTDLLAHLSATLRALDPAETAHAAQPVPTRPDADPGAHSPAHASADAVVGEKSGETAGAKAGP